MNQVKVKELRKLFVPHFAEGDPRNKTSWRRMKREYKNLPWGARRLFLDGLALLRRNNNNQS